MMTFFIKVQIKGRRVTSKLTALNLTMGEAYLWGL